MSEGNGNFEWSFGFGSNMDPAFMESSKGLKVTRMLFDSHPHTELGSVRNCSFESFVLAF